MRPLRRWAVIALIALGACSSDAAQDAPVADRTTTTTPTTAAVGVDTAAYVESGDYDNGRHLALITAFEDASVTFDVVQLLTGDAARQALRAEHPDMEGDEPDFFVRNQSKRLRTLPLAASLEIRVNNTGGHPPADPDKSHEVNRSTFAGYARAGELAGPFWLTIAAGEVVAVEEQYLP